MTATTAELLTIGNEILAGDVVDTNSHWLCRQLVGHGVRVSRITTIPDDAGVIGEVFLAALARSPALIVTCGGLGPTSDDLTLAAIGAALGRPLADDLRAREMVSAFYATLYAQGRVSTPDLTPERAKMARLPAGSIPLENTVGAAPGVLLTAGTTLVACLPGVPAEMKAIFEGSLWPRLAARFSDQVYVERIVRTDCLDESIMAPAVDGVAARHPQVYVKSRAQAYGSGLADFVTLSARGADPVEVTAWLDAAEMDLRAALAAAGITVVAPTPA